MNPIIEQDKQGRWFVIRETGEYVAGAPVAQFLAGPYDEKSDAVWECARHAFFQELN